MNRITSMTAGTSSPPPDEFAKEWQDRRLPMRQEHRPDIRAGAVDVYRFRQEPNGGERSAIAAPTG